MKLIKRCLIKWLFNEEEIASIISLQKNILQEHKNTNEGKNYVVSDNEMEKHLVQDDNKSDFFDEEKDMPPQSPATSGVDDTIESEITISHQALNLTETQPSEPNIDIDPNTESKPIQHLNPSPIEEAAALAIDTEDWIIVGASVIGKGHVSAKTPCQDNHKYEYLGNGWGIAITSDGAGSAENSHIGSKLVCESCLLRFKSLIMRENWMKKNELPTDVEWTRHSYLTLKTVRDDIDNFSQKHNFLLKSLRATVIVVIHTPVGILVTHIGDGRAGYKNEKGEWKALIKPHKGEEANQTIFLSDEYWRDNYPYVMSHILVPESVIIFEKPVAFALMSDGCEKTAWQCYQKNEKTGIYFDPNVPHEPFFNPLCEHLQSFRRDNVGCDERKESWKVFLASGNQSFEKEKDDKTMILGVLYK